jgi:hypothetical protein
MVSFWEREGHYVRCEARAADAGRGYELIVVRPDGTQELEQFDNAEDLLKRQLQLERSFEADGWVGPFGRVF